MSDSDKDTSAAINKVVGAFRAQREQGKAAAPEADSEPKREPTPVTRLDEPAPKPQGGGGSEAPTKAFKVPAEAIAAATAATGDDRTGKELREETVVGDEMSADASDVAAIVDAPVTEKADLVEHSVELSDETADTDDAAETPEAQPTDDAPTEAIPADQVAAAAEIGESEAPTTKMKVPAAAVAAAAATTAAAATAGKASAAKAPVESIPKPEPKVVAPAAKEAGKRKSGKLVAILLAVLVVIAVVAVGLWYLLVGQSDENKVADAAKDYQNAMADGDLDDLRDLTCGAKYDYYSTVSPEDFQKAVDAQKARNELMTFDDVQAVQIDGDVARVGVDMYPSSDPSKKVPAQITLHKIDGAWKVCTRP
ncbi:DUF4878 domain-containing protein [Gordonia phthalatica]|uniref:DUF4878 domain-containing protein n=1 Tax=Gordonia phthalatica TaxID=1136941 RepID=A0A0N9NED9_9ACTN|nr:DUF4878 domain-containing protein [Gordonia phthalatica]ALG86048.1 hypothetical protein ACH46_18025 [Gordonia phthalatica]